MLVKHRDETAKFAVDFEDILATGEAITSVDSVIVTFDTNPKKWDDVTTEFGATNPTINGTLVEFTLNEAVDSEHQRKKQYFVRVKVLTDAAQELVAVSGLVVVQIASP